MDDSDKNGLKITIVRLENMTPPTKIKVEVWLCDRRLGTSEVYNVDQAEMDLNWTMFYELNDNCENYLGDFVSYPLLFKVLYDGTISSNIQGKISEKANKKKSRKKTTSPKSSRKNLNNEQSLGNVTNESSETSAQLRTTLPIKHSSQYDSSFTILGVGNVDMLPLIMGKTYVEENLQVHPTTWKKGSHVTAWDNLPRLLVLIDKQGVSLQNISSNVTNILNFTLESMHNVNLDSLGKTEVATVLPRDMEFQVIKFTNADIVLDSLPFLSTRKKWFGLSNIQGLGAFSQYRSSRYADELINEMDCVITEDVLKQSQTIKWNHLYRIHLTPESRDSFKDKLLKYRCWPLEIVCFSLRDRKVRRTDTNKNKQDALIDETLTLSGKPESGEVMKANHYLAFVELSRLLYPGETSARVTAQLFTHTQGAMERRFGSEHNMFETKPNSSATFSSKSNEIQSKTITSTVKKENKKEKRVVSKLEQKISDKEYIPPAEPEPVYNEKGEPVFIIVQVELLSPLLNKKTPEETLESIHQIIPRRHYPTKEETSTINATGEFEASLWSLMHAIHEEYQTYFCENDHVHDEESSKNFLMHLHKTGAHSKLKETLTKPMEEYILNVLGIPHELNTIKYDHQDVLSDIYISLVSKMREIVNSHSSDLNEYDAEVSCKELAYFAAESTEEEDYDKTEEHLLTGIEKFNKGEPIFWLNYAKYFIKKQDFVKAGECTKEAISLDPRYVPALLFHGLLSWLTEDIAAAEMFLQAAVSFNPYILESWVVLYMFHKETNRQHEADVELSNGKKCARNCYSYPDDLMPLLSWSSKVIDVQRIFLLTASYIIQLSFPELAEIALSHDLLLHGRTVDFLYYLAVCHYEQQRYLDSLRHLEEALTIRWEDPRLWALKGHNLYKLQRKSEAKEAFNFYINCNDMSDDTHLINLRLGNIAMNDNDYTEARAFYLAACKQHPTPLSWLGLGIAAYEGGGLDEAELALNEANMLDCRSGAVWRALGLVAQARGRLHSEVLAERCLAQARRLGTDGGCCGISRNVVAPLSPGRGAGLLAASSALDDGALDKCLCRFPSLVEDATKNPDYSMPSSYFMNDKSKRLYKLVLTGGPCGGKTTAQSRLCTFFENLGWKVFRVTETATVLLGGGIKFADLSEEQVYKFQENLLKMVLRLENTFFDLAESCERDCLIICDRGTMDASAYIPRDMWERIVSSNGWNSVELRDNRYNQIVHLVSAAVGAEDFYTTEDHACRSEALEDARGLDVKAAAAWVGHPYFDVIDNSTDFETKIRRLIGIVCQNLGIETGLTTNSRKRKFLVQGPLPDDSSFPPFQDFLVVNDFLKTSTPGMQVRLRKRGQKDSTGLAGYWSYIHRVRKPEVRGQVVEVRTQLTRREYTNMLAQRDDSHFTVFKRRRCFIVNNHYFQLDKYREPCHPRCKDLLVLETNSALDDTTLQTCLPQFLTVVKEVSGNPEFSMFNLSLREDWATSNKFCRDFQGDKK